MTVRLIDSAWLKRNLNKVFPRECNQLYGMLQLIDESPTLTPSNEPMLERVDQADSGCDRCSGPEDTALDAGGAHDFHVVGDAIYYCDSDYGWEGTKIKFCPWCGRSLASNTQVDILTGEKYEE